MKEEALKLADEEAFISTTIEALEWARNANNMLRKMVAELDKQEKEMDLVVRIVCGDIVPNELMGYYNPLHSTLMDKLNKEKAKIGVLADSCPDNCFNKTANLDSSVSQEPHGFARAILKKASEK